MGQCVAHRGWSGRAPENTIAAFKLALAEDAISAIELDVHLSKDGVPVVIHDHWIDRTTNGTGMVGAYTFDELSQFDAGSWFDPSFEGERIPSLEDVLHLTKGKKNLVIELKALPSFYNGLEEAVTKLVHQYDMTDDVLFISFDHESIKRMNELDPAFQTGLLFMGRSTLILEQLNYTGAMNASIHYPYVTKEIVDTLLEAGKQVSVWTVDNPAHIQAVLSIHPDLNITTNHPDRVFKAKVGS